MSCFTHSLTVKGIAFARDRMMSENCDSRTIPAAQRRHADGPGTCSRHDQHDLPGQAAFRPAWARCSRRSDGVPTCSTASGRIWRLLSWLRLDPVGLRPDLRPLRPAAAPQTACFGRFPAASGPEPARPYRRAGPATGWRPAGGKHHRRSWKIMAACAAKGGGSAGKARNGGRPPWLKGVVCRTRVIFKVSGHIV